MAKSATDDISVVVVVHLLIASLHLFTCRSNAGQSQPSTSAVDSRDFCLHESFNASCRLSGGAPAGVGDGGGSGGVTVILMVSAIYGRMHMGRCVNGDFNIGCSKDVLTYFDSQCSTKQSCDVSIRNLVDIHPCQRDFMSYLEATYRCIEVHGLGMTGCPKEGRLAMTGRTGYFSTAHGPHRSPIGSESCPWVITVLPGQRVHLKVILLHQENANPVKAEEAVTCSSVFVIRDNFAVGTKELGICAGKSRERHFFTSAGHEIVLFLSRGVSRDFRLIEQKDYPRFIVNYEAIGCPDLVVPSNAWIKRAGDNVMIKCNDTMETWYFTCQRSQWIGDIGNCSQKGVQRLKNDELHAELTFPAHGIVLAVLIGILLGMFVGMILLLAINCARHRSKCSLKKRQALFLASHCSGVGSESTDLSLPAFHRNSRPRDDRYPALLMSAEKICDMEKLYDFSATAASSLCGGGDAAEMNGGAMGCGGEADGELRCYHPTMTMVDYTAIIDRSLADNLENARILSSASAAEAAEDDYPHHHFNHLHHHHHHHLLQTDRRLLSSRGQSCPLCVRRNCDCLQDNDNIGHRLFVGRSPFGDVVESAGNTGSDDRIDDVIVSVAMTTSGGTVKTAAEEADCLQQLRRPCHEDGRENLALQPTGSEGPDVAPLAPPLVSFQEETDRVVNIASICTTPSSAIKKT